MRLRNHLIFAVPACQPRCNTAPRSLRERASGFARLTAVLMLMGILGAPVRAKPVPPVSSQDGSAATLQIEATADTATGPALVTIDAAALARRPAAIRFTLPDGSAFMARVRDFEPREAGASWRGRTDGTRLRQNVLLTLHRGLIAGRIDLGDRSFVLEPAAPNRSRLVEVGSGGAACGVRDPDAVAPATPEQLLVERSASEAIDAAAPVITVLGLYTTSAREAAGGDAEIEALIQAGIDATNMVFANSDIAARVQLTGTEPLELDRFGSLPDLETALGALQDDARIGELRDAAGADLVAAIFENGGGLCGFANAMDDVGARFAPQAYSITVRSCVLPRLALTHEIGHNLGARHNPEDSDATPTTASFPWSFGHATPDFHTVMALESRCSPCRSVPLFSAPQSTVTVRGEEVPAGIEGTRDNRRTLQETTAVAASFRSPIPTCFEDGSNLCLTNERFEVRVEWRDQAGNIGIGRPAVSGADSGLFWFFEPDNWELMVKVIDACSFSETFWVFAAASTDVEYSLRVTDTWNGETRTYFNPLGQAAPAITDTTAFRTCDGP